MSGPVIHPFPVKRPGFIKSADWLGDDAHLTLRVTYEDIGGILRSLQFRTRNLGDGEKGDVCLPASTDLVNLGVRARDVLIAHTRMACMIAGLAVPGSQEFTNAFTAQEGSINLQTSLGTVKVTAVEIVDDQNVKLTFKQGSGPAYDVVCDHGELNRYSFAPDTQLLVLPGAVKKQFPSYVHEWGGSLLNDAKKAEILAYVLTLEPWI